MQPDTTTDAGSLSPFWAVYRPAFEQHLARVVASRGRGVEVAAGPVAKAKAAGIPVAAADGVAVVGVKGPLEKRGSWFLRMFGGSSYLAIRAALNAAMADKSVYEIMLLVDSPGGSVDGLADLGDFVREARAAKSITAYADGMAASAAYYLASQATEVVAGRTALVGSIGAITYLYDMSESFKKAGVEPVVISTGEHKGTGIPGTKVTDEQKAELQRIVDFYEADFETAIVQGRRMDPKAVSKLATGEVWAAPEAVELGLVDRLGTFEDTVAGLQRRVGLARRTRRVRADASGHAKKI